MDCKEIQPVHPKGDQSWVFTGRTDVEAETPILWPPHAKSWLIWKDPDAGKDWRQEEKGMTEDKVFGWHHQHNGYEFEWTLGVGDGQGGLVCCGPWGCKELDMTERLNWTELKPKYIYPAAPNPWGVSPKGKARIPREMDSFFKKILLTFSSLILKKAAQWLWTVEDSTPLPAGKEGASLLLSLCLSHPSESDCREVSRVGPGWKCEEGFHFLFSGPNSRKFCLIKKSQGPDRWRKLKGWRKIMEVGVLASGTANEGLPQRKATKALYVNSQQVSLSTQTQCVYTFQPLHFRKYLKTRKGKYWVSQKTCLGLSIGWCRKLWTFWPTQYVNNNSEGSFCGGGGYTYILKMRTCSTVNNEESFQLWGSIL